MSSLPSRSLFTQLVDDAAIFPPGTVIADAAVSLLHKLAERRGYDLS